VRRIVGGIATVAVLAACASANIEGGALVARGAEPTGVTIGRWRVSGCRDSEGAPLPYGDAQVRVVEMIDGKMALVEVHELADSVVVRNVSRASGGWVFALVLGRTSGNKDLYEYSVPQEGGRDGRFVIARHWTDRATVGGFVGTYAKASVTCALVPEARSS
jgi:hypothetical protein